MTGGRHVVDPDSLNPDPNPAFQVDPDPDTAFQVNPDPDPEQEF
jgi:hypothetical protein